MMKMRSCLLGAIVLVVLLFAHACQGRRLNNCKPACPSGRTCIDGVCVIADTTNQELDTVEKDMNTNQLQCQSGETMQLDMYGNPVTCSRYFPNCQEDYYCRAESSTGICCSVTKPA